jgi:hypothetical protein
LAAAAGAHHIYTAQANETPDLLSAYSPMLPYNQQHGLVWLLLLLLLLLLPAGLPEVTAWLRQRSGTNFCSKLRKVRSAVINQ